MTKSRVGNLLCRKVEKAWAKRPFDPWLLTNGVLFLLLSWHASAFAISQNFAYVGPIGFTMEGNFSYSDVLIGTGPINQTQIDTLMIEGFLYGSSLGTWSLADGLGTGAAPFILNFDTTNNTFLEGDIEGVFNLSGISGGFNQAWNLEGDPGLGFARGFDSANNFEMEGMTVDGDLALSAFGALSSQLTIGTLDQFTQSAFNFSYTGPIGYSIEGMFSYWDVFDNGRITGGELTSFMMEGFLNGTSIGTYDLGADILGRMATGDTTGLSPFHFFFDTTTNTFLEGAIVPGFTFPGVPGAPSGGFNQAWNYLGDPGLGFARGFDSVNNGDLEALTQDGVFELVAFSSGGSLGSTLTATPKNGVASLPEPSSVLLFGTGIVGLLTWLRKAEKQTS